jgi:hypothetical protein
LKAAEPDKEHCHFASKRRQVAMFRVIVFSDPLCAFDPGHIRLIAATWIDPAASAGVPVVARDPWLLMPAG